LCATPEWRWAGLRHNGRWTSPFEVPTLEASPTRRWRIWMEPNHLTATAGPQEVVAKIDQKALRLSALLREIDNHPIELETALRTSSMTFWRCWRAVSPPPGRCCTDPASN